jgi:hypothetical protein
MGFNVIEEMSENGLAEGGGSKKCVRPVKWLL